MAYTPAPPTVRRRRSNTFWFAAVAVTTVVMAAVVTVAILLSRSDAAPTKSAPPGETGQPAAEPPAPVADIGPIRAVFDDTNANESWYGWVEQLSFTGDLLVVETTLDDRDGSKAGYFICQGVAAAVESTGTDGVRKIVVRSSGNVTLAGRDRDDVVCWD